MPLWLEITLSALATWRITHLLSNEDGPWDCFANLRTWAGRGFLGELMHCFNCLSLWIAAPFAWRLDIALVHRVIAWLALSAAAILLERATQKPVEIDIRD